MKFVDERSERIRAMVNLILAEKNVVRRDFARRLEGMRSPASAYRLLSTSQPLDDKHVDWLLTAAAAEAGVPVARLYLAVREPFDPAIVPEAELSVATLQWMGGHKHEQLISQVNAAEKCCRRRLIYSSHVPLFLLDAETTEIAVVNIIRECASKLTAAEPTLRDTLAEQHEMFMLDYPVSRSGRITVVTLLSGLLGIVEKRGPFQGCEDEHVAASLLSLLHDAVVDRDINLAVLNDVIPGPAKVWAETYQAFQTIELFDSRLLIKRRWNTLACRTFDASSGSPAQAVISQHERELARGATLACHGLTKPDTIAFLSDFIEAAGFGPVTRYRFN